MTKVQHPAFPEIVHEVEDDELDEHLSAGWVEADDATALHGEHGPELADLPPGGLVSLRDE